MSGRIPEDIIEQVRTASDIADIIGSYIKLKKRGRNYQALCPFHQEKTPSFSVSPDKQIYHCFGCGKGGNVFTFLMEHENMSFVDAVKMLADKAGIRIPEPQVDDARKEELDRLYYAHQLALEYYRRVLDSSEYKDRMRKYLMDQRGINEESIELFQLGLAGESWEGFFNHALKKGLFPKELLKAGLAGYSERKDKYYDRFRLRLMIPIFNLSGKVIAFGGRALKKGEVAKYINSPETPLYNKSNVLYGLNFSKQFIRDSNEVIVVEGYFDVISLYQNGVKNVVASSGTAFTSQQAKLLARFADKVFLFFDSDSAGQLAAFRSINYFYDVGLDVVVITAPDGEDPDSIARNNGADAIFELKNNALNYIDFRLQNINSKKIGFKNKKDLIDEFIALAQSVEDKTNRDSLISNFSDRMSIQPSIIYEKIRVDTVPKTKENVVKSPRKIIDFERDLLSLVLNYPDYFDILYEHLKPEDLQTEKLANIYTLFYEQYQILGNISVNRIIDSTDDRTVINGITYLANIEWDSRNISQIISDYVKKIMNFKNEREIDQLRAKLKLAEEKGDDKEAENLTDQITELIKKRQ